MFQMWSAYNTPAYSWTISSCMRIKVLVNAQKLED